MYYQNILTKLQKQASEFLHNKYLFVHGVAIYLKEIEVYYFEQGKFEDYTVHKNELQANNEYKFYIHRYGQRKDSKYISGTRGGCDLVLSTYDGIYYSFLIRSIVINGELIVGPRKSLNAILEKTGLSYEGLENVHVEIKNKNNYCDVLSTLRIGLGISDNSNDLFYKNAELRFIMCDEYFKKRDRNNVGYAQRTVAIDNFLKKNLETGKMTKEQAIKYSERWYGAVSKWLKELKE